MRDIIDRIAADPAFRQRLAEDPGSVARDLGYGTRIEEARRLLDLPETGLREMVEALRYRLALLRSGKWL